MGLAAVVGLGAGASVAMILAEQYAVHSLVVIAPERGVGSKAQALMRLAERNLFAVVAPTMIVETLGNKRHAGHVKRIVRGVSARRCQTLWLEGECPLGVPGAARSQALAAIVTHLRHAYDTNSLAY